MPNSGLLRFERAASGANGCSVSAAANLPALTKIRLDPGAAEALEDCRATRANDGAANARSARVA